MGYAWMVKADTLAKHAEGAAERLQYDIAASAIAGTEAAGAKWANYRDCLRKTFEQVLGLVNTQRLVNEYQALLGMLGSFGLRGFSVDKKLLFVNKEIGRAHV